jgi:hypothetical protein
MKSEGLLEMKRNEELKIFRKNEPVIGRNE